jgi:formylmethanofuran dehydrogenase subunit C
MPEIQNTEVGNDINETKNYGITVGRILIEGFAATGIGIAMLSVLAIPGLCWTRVGQADEVKKLLIDKLSGGDHIQELYKKF